MIVGSGQFRYRVVAEWAKLPDGWSFKEVGGVGVDRHDNVYVFNRGEHPMIIFDREGNFLRSWGEGQYPRAHGTLRSRTSKAFADVGDGRLGRTDRRRGGCMPAHISFVVDAPLQQQTTNAQLSQGQNRQSSP